MQRNQDQTHLRVFYTASTSFEPAQAHLVPSAPTEPVTVPAHLPGQLPVQLPLIGTRPLAAQNFVGNGALCVNNQPDCFCARYGPENLFQCKQACL